MGKIQIKDGENDVAAAEPEKADVKPEEKQTDAETGEVDESSEAETPESRQVSVESEDGGESIPVAKSAPAPKSNPQPKPNLSPMPIPKPKPAIEPVQAQPVPQPAAPSIESNDPPVEEQNVFEAASHATDSDAETDYSQYTPLRKPQKKWKKVLLYIVATIICIGGVAAGGYALMKQKNASKPAAHTSSSDKKTSNNSSTSSNQSQSNAPPAGTKNYSSSNLKVSFDYPEKWTVDDSGGGKLTVTSPSMQLTDASGQKQTGQIILKIENQASADMSDFKTGSAVAVLASQKIDYTNPTGGQRADTYISFVQYNTTTTKGGLDGIYITGNLGYKYAQQITESDISKIDPLVRVVFVKCSDDKCSDTSPLTISSDMWKSSDFADPITNMLKSLSFQ